MTRAPECLIIGHDETGHGRSGKSGEAGHCGDPPKIRRLFGIEEGTTVLVDAGPEGVLIRPAVTVPVEAYSTERKATFILESWLTAADYPKLRDQVRRMGVDPEKIPHTRPE